VRWSLDFGQTVKLDPAAAATNADDGQAEAVHSGIQAEGRAGGAAARIAGGEAGGEARHTPDLVGEWRRQVMESLASVFSGKAEAEEAAFRRRSRSLLKPISRQFGG
jgi:hypothetical protein